MSYLSNLKTRRDYVTAQLAAMTSTSLGGKADNAQADGGTAVAHVAYRKSLLDELKQLNELIRSAAVEESFAAGEENVSETSTQIIQ